MNFKKHRLLSSEMFETSRLLELNKVNQKFEKKSQENMAGREYCNARSFTTEIKLLNKKN